MDVAAREKEIRFSSRTRQVSDQVMRIRKDREIARKVIAKLPEALQDDPDVLALAACSAEHPVNLVQLIYRTNAWEGGSRDFEFSARTMREHWQAGHEAVNETMANARLVAREYRDRQKRRVRPDGAPADPVIRRSCNATTETAMFLKGKSAIITGSTSGIGLAYAKAFAAEGASV